MGDTLETCEKCEEAFGEVQCSCGARYCEACFVAKHLIRNPRHRRGGNKKTEMAWAWISGKATSLKDTALRAVLFERDEASKWFGLHIQKDGEDRVTRLVETYRFSQLVEASRCHYNDSPRRQFPSITSFIGDTGSGKSTLSIYTQNLSPGYALC